MKLDDWINQRHGIKGRAAMDAALPGLLRAAVEAAKRAPLYRDYPLPQTLADFEALPLIDDETLRLRAPEMLCLSQDKIRRIVTLFTSGTTAGPKRVFFSEADLERTVDYFDHGMRLVAASGEACAVFLPCEAPDGVGDLLSRGLARLGVKPLRHGLIGDLAAAAACEAPSAVGLPTQMLTLCEYKKSRALPLFRRVLLSADFISPALIQRLRAMGVEAYTHYGLTESGYGCAIDCAAHAGMHVRENDLYMEVIDEKGKAVYDQWGELVLTTLGERAMPFIRYRTGDTAKVTKAPCACGSYLKRLFLRGRDAHIERLDEVLLSLPGVVDYTALRRAEMVEVTLYTLGTVPLLPALPHTVFAVRPLGAFAPPCEGKRRLL